MYGRKDLDDTWSFLSGMVESQHVLFEWIGWKPKIDPCIDVLLTKMCILFKRRDSYTVGNMPKGITQFWKRHWKPHKHSPWLAVTTVCFPPLCTDMLAGCTLHWCGQKKRDSCGLSKYVQGRPRWQPTLCREQMWARVTSLAPCMRCLVGGLLFAHMSTHVEPAGHCLLLNFANAAFSLSCSAMPIVWICTM